MNYEEAIRELNPLIKGVWGKVEGYWKDIAPIYIPGPNQKARLDAINAEIKAGESKKGFWGLFNFLADYLLGQLPSFELTKKEVDKMLGILGKIDDRNEVVVQILSLIDRNICSTNESLQLTARRTLKLLRESLPTPTTVL